MLFGELDGTFPNHPADPIQPENLVDLQTRGARRAAPTSGSRSTATPTGCSSSTTGPSRCPGSTTTAIVAQRHPRAASPGETVVHNLICSKAVPEVVREHGGTPVRTRVGHSFIKQVMAETGAIFGGEHSAHYYFRDNYRADSGHHRGDGRARAAVAAPACRSRSCASRSSATPRPVRSTPRVDDPARGDRAASPRPTPTPTQDRLDGLTVDLGDWWFNLRPSNTEPLLRLNLEAADADACDAHTAEVLALRPRRRRLTLADDRRRTAVTTERSGGSTVALDPQLLEILACPEDKGPLLYFADESSLYNPRLKRRYAVRDDIPIMLDRRGRDGRRRRARSGSLAKAEADGIRPTFEA